MKQKGMKAFVLVLLISAHGAFGMEFIKKEVSSFIKENKKSFLALSFCASSGISGVLVRTFLPKIKVVREYTESEIGQAHNLLGSKIIDDENTKLVMPDNFMVKLKQKGFDEGVEKTTKEFADKLKGVTGDIFLHGSLSVGWDKILKDNFRISKDIIGKLSNIFEVEYGNLPDGWEKRLVKEEEHSELYVKSLRLTSDLKDCRESKKKK